MRRAERHFVTLSKSSPDPTGENRNHRANRQRLIIVGNAPVLTRGPLHPWVDPQEMADFIDSSDSVVRMNVPLNYDRPGAGSKTDILALVPIEEFATRTRIPNHIQSGIEEIWLVRPDGRGSAPQSQRQRAERGVWPTHLSDAIIGFQGWHNKRVRFFDAGLQHDLARHLRTGDGLFRPPSTGMCTIEMALHDPRFTDYDIYVVGFGFQGWHMHPFDAERARVSELIAEGRLKTLADVGLSRNVPYNTYDVVLMAPRLAVLWLRRLQARIREPRGVIDEPAD